MRNYYESNLESNSDSSCEINKLKKTWFQWSHSLLNKIEVSKSDIYITLQKKVWIPSCWNLYMMVEIKKYTG